MNKNKKKGSEAGSIYQINVTYDVPTQLASLDLLKSEEMEGNTVEKGSTKENIIM